jgi:hypothetical protein
MAICPNSVLNGPAFCSRGGLGAIFCILLGKISLFLLNRRDNLHYRYWLEKYLLWSAPSLEESGYVSLAHTCREFFTQMY